MNNPPVAIIGLGLMGEVYAQRLLDAGIPVSGYDVDPARRARLAEIGGQPADSIAALAKPSRCILIAVFSTAQVEDVIENHLLPALGDGSNKIVACLSTCDPDEGGGARRPCHPARHPLPRCAGVGYQRSGAARRRRGADRRRQGGGGELAPIFDALFARRFHVGKIGDGGRAKLAVNLILGLNRLALAEGLVFAERMGLDPAAVSRGGEGVGVLFSGHGNQGAKDGARRLLAEGRVKQTLKDAHMMLDQGAALGQPLLSLQIHADTLEACVKAGEADLDNSAIIKEVRRRGDKT
ncbi:MAG: NAD(P)-binding domain-containing protein [Pseudolabrys sp.]